MTRAGSWKGGHVKIAKQMVQDWAYAILSGKESVHSLVYLTREWEAVEADAEKIARKVATLATPMKKDAFFAGSAYAAYRERNREILAGLLKAMPKNPFVLDHLADFEPDPKARLALKLKARKCAWKDDEEFIAGLEQEIAELQQILRPTAQSVPAARASARKPKR